MSAFSDKNALLDLTDEFQQIAENLATYFSHIGITVKPYHDRSLPRFSKLSEEKKKKALFFLQLFWTITQSTGQSDLKNNSRALWAAMKSVGLRHGSSFFQHLEDDDQIEIYNLEGVQIWRNFNVLKICSYTLEEVHSYEWIDRYERNDKDTQTILKVIAQVLQKSGPEPIHANIPYHFVRERFSERQLLLNVCHDHFVPLFDEKNQIAAFLVTSKVEIVKETAEPVPMRPAAPKLSLVADDIQL